MTTTKKPAAKTPRVAAAQPPIDNAFVAPCAEQFSEPEVEEAAAPVGIFTIEQARALPVVEFHADNVPFASEDARHVRKFGSEDGLRLMQIVHVAGGLACQQVEE